MIDASIFAIKPRRREAGARLWRDYVANTPVANFRYAITYRSSHYTVLYDFVERELFAYNYRGPYVQPVFVARDVSPVNFSTFTSFRFFFRKISTSYRQRILARLVITDSFRTSPPSRALDNYENYAGVKKRRPLIDRNVECSTRNVVCRVKRTRTEIVRALRNER